MSVIVIAETPGLDAEGYERIVKEHGHRIDELPADCTAHFAGPAGEAWRAVAVWDSAEQAAESGRTVLSPSLVFSLFRAATGWLPAAATNTPIAALPTAVPARS